jgi:sRNA-binding protein
LTSNLFGCEKKKERLQKERREQQQEESNIMAAATDTDTPRATKRSRAQERQLIKEEGDADFADEYYPPFATPLSPSPLTLSFSKVLRT